MDVFLAIDQSTSATKALLFNCQGELLGSTSLPHRQIYPQPGWVEHDAEEIYTNTLHAARLLLEQHPSQLPALRWISLTNQRETVVVFERATGRPLYNALVWQDTRGEAICTGLSAGGLDDVVQRKTGLKIDTYFSASKLRWLVDEHPVLAEKLASGQALVGTIDAYLIYRLTGGAVFATDVTNASRTLLYNIASLSWDEELGRIFHVPLPALPEVRESSAQFGETTLEGLLSRPRPICGVMGDSQAALFGQRCFTPGSAKVTFGTGSSILLNIGPEFQLPAPGAVTTIAWVHRGVPTYAFEGITNFTGATLAWLRDQLQLIQDVSETEAIARSVPDNGGVYLVPAFAGLSAPYWRPDARAAISGLSASSGKAHVVRAALESIAYLITDVLRMLSGQGGVALQRIQADGGATRNRFLMQFVADISQLLVQSSDTAELSALGAGLSGALGMGVYASPDDFQSLQLTYQNYTPQMEPAQAQALFAGWQKAVAQALS